MRACNNEKMDGIVMEGAGAGNVNRPIFDALRESLESGIPVVVGTRILSGAAHLNKGGIFTPLSADRGRHRSAHETFIFNYSIYISRFLFYNTTINSTSLLTELRLCQAHKRRIRLARLLVLLLMIRTQRKEKIN